MTSVGDWWRGIPSVTVDVDCDGGRHRLTWRDGELHADDHDAESEQVLGALGARLPYCVEVTRAWRAVGPDPYIVMTWDDRRPTRLAADHNRNVVHTLPPVLYDRLALGVVAALHADPRLPGRESRWSTYDVSHPASRRAVPALHESIRSWWGRGEPGPEPLVDCRIAGPDEGGSVEGRIDRRGGWVEIAIGPLWLLDVWARDAAVVDGCFILAAAPAAVPGRGDNGHDGDDAPLDVVAVRWERTAAGTLDPVCDAAVLHRTPAVDRRWRLRWSDVS